MKHKIVICLRIIWRNIVFPVILALPKRRQLQIRTLVHYAKLTLWNGHVIEFDANIANGNSVKLTQSISTNFDDTTPVSQIPFSSSKIVPAWAVNEFYELAKIEPQLYPTPEFISKFHHWHTPVERDSGDIFANCIERLDKYNPDLIIIVPWIIPGGADRGILHHVTAALSLGKNVLVISTVNAESPWAKQLPSDAKFLELGKLGSKLLDEQRVAVLTRIVLQSPAKVVHVINSQMGWEMIRKHGKSFNHIDKKIFASVFCDDFDSYGALRSYPQMYLEECWRYLRGLICDTQWYPQDLKRQYGVPLDNINTVYFPINVNSPLIYKAKTNNNILWAGRFSNQKRLDLLVEIAKFLPDVNFDVYGYSVLDRERDMEKQMRQLPNVNVHGAFDSINTLVDAKEYSLFLYTSGWDGLPLTLLDVTVAGLPIVASAVGGVPEFITEETGYLVTDINDPSAYVLRITEALGDEISKHRKWAAAVDLIASRHTPDHFLQQLKGVAGYLGDD